MTTVQKRVGEFVQRHNLQAPADIRFIDLVSEIGELGKELLKGSNYGTYNFSPTANTQNELGDVVFSLCCLANILDVDIDAALQSALDKYEARFEKTGGVGSGDVPRTATSYRITEVTDPQEKSRICEAILLALPNWFGIPESTAEYIAGVADKPFYAAFEGSHAIGFVSLLPHNAHTTEIYVMGLLETHHRKGIGRRLVQAGESFCRETMRTFFTVKTLADTHPDEYYAKTRQFYTAMGFKPLEVFTELWGESNPCLFMGKGV
ncbi:MAG: GNAT family N-acetyltransferase [Defluviitaleaceae bacterium]|nr:GNAT family N-acetyltransferase [Defluviitaleaceae bacterium]MCL2274618.1 GNAT family N-acetyltransferase [Defluviitaleaceae bacterium]